jgi:hypothetical protein
MHVNFFARRRLKQRTLCCTLEPSTIKKQHEASNYKHMHHADRIGIYIVMPENHSRNSLLLLMCSLPWGVCRWRSIRDRQIRLIALITVLWDWDSVCSRTKILAELIYQFCIRCVYRELHNLYNIWREKRDRTDKKFFYHYLLVKKVEGALGGTEICLQH